MGLDYEYYCKENEKTLLVRHGMTETIQTWAQLCARAGIEDNSATADAPVERIISGGMLALARRVSKEAPRTDLDAILCGPGDSCLPCCEPQAEPQE